MRHYFRQHAAFALLAAAMVGVLAMPAGAAPKGTLSDQNITDAIGDEFLFDRAVPFNEINIKTSDGKVMLSGTVSNLLAKERAERIAQTVKGVQSVDNTIRVQPKKDRSDKALRQDIENALLADAAADSYEIDVKVNDGKAVLSGQVQSWQERQIAQKVAASVNGVTDIENDIKVQYKTDRPDVEIRPEIEKALRWSVLVDHGLIDVKVEDGRVTLDGIVGSAAEKRQAEYEAWVAGVESVDASGLKVEKWARDEDMRTGKYIEVKDTEIKQAIENAMARNPRVYSFNVTPSVEDNSVTLRGTVDNVKAKNAAARIARNTVGVRDVTNHIKVRTEEKMGDSDLADKIRNALLRDPYTESFEISVKVDDNTATLSGTVDSYFEKAQADEIASKVQGITEVRNRIDVDYTQYPLAYDPYVYDYDPYDFDWYDYKPYYTVTSDPEIKEEINDEMWWSPFVDSDEVNVSVENGVATLTGTVETWSERQAATENAYEGGATWVHNKLNVEQFQEGAGE